MGNLSGKAGCLSFVAGQAYWVDLFGVVDGLAKSKENDVVSRGRVRVTGMFEDLFHLNDFSARGLKVRAQTERQRRGGPIKILRN